MAFAFAEDRTAFNARMSAEVVRPALFCYIDWPGSPIRASTHTRSVSAAGHTWAGVGEAGTIDVDAARQTGAAQRWAVGLRGVPVVPVDVATQASAVGRDAEIYLGAFDADWQTPELALLFKGYAGGRRVGARRTEDGFLVDVEVELTDEVNPRRAVQFHWAPGANGADTAQRLLYTVARPIPWPGRAG